MKYFFLIIICITANSCEKLIYGEYKILDHFQSDNKINQNTYKVLDGDNLYSISKKKKVSLKKLIEINKITYPYKIFKNQIIFIPQKESHIVSKGETLYSISRKYNVDQYSLVYGGRTFNCYGEHIYSPRSNNFMHPTSNRSVPQCVVVPQGLCSRQTQGLSSGQTQGLLFTYQNS